MIVTINEKLNILTYIILHILKLNFSRIIKYSLILNARLQVYMLKKEKYCLELYCKVTRAFSTFNFDTSNVPRARETITDIHKVQHLILLNILSLC